MSDSDLAEFPAIEIFPVSTLKPRPAQTPEKQQVQSTASARGSLRTPVAPSNRALVAPPISRRADAPPPEKKSKKTEKPYVLLWVATNGKDKLGWSRKKVWKQKELRVIGEFADKTAVEAKKAQLMVLYDSKKNELSGGKGDISVGGILGDQIDLVLRPIEEVKLGESELSADSRRDAAPPPAKKLKKTEKPHVLLWIATNGKDKKGWSRKKVWKQKDLRVIGEYADKMAAEAKKAQLMVQYDSKINELCGGKGDISTGGILSDQIDLVVRPIEEV